MGYDTKKTDPRDGAEPMDTPPAEDEHAAPISALHPEHEAAHALDGWLFKEPPPRRWLLRDIRTRGREGGHAGMLPAGIPAMIAAPGGVGKTYALMQLAVSVATGTDWLEKFRPEEPGRVLLFLAEEHRAEVHNRLHECARLANAFPREDGHDGKRAELLHTNLRAVPLCGEIIRLTDAGGFPMSAAKDLTAHVEAFKPVLVILDPLIAFAGLDVEKDNALAYAFMAEVRKAVGATGDDGPTVMFAHHSTKTSRQNAAGGAETARGSGALVDNARWLVTLTAKQNNNNEPTGQVEFRLAKGNSIGEIWPLTLTRAGRHDGCLVVAPEADNGKVKKAKPKPGETAPL